MKTIAIIGGGITGLSAAYEMQKQAQEQRLEVQFLLIERNDYVGGKIHTAYTEEFKMETGADSIVARHPGVLELVRELQMEQQKVYN